MLFKCKICGEVDDTNNESERQDICKGCYRFEIVTKFLNKELKVIEE
jgi:hypothetical protein